ncbi:MAG: hypothetical protein M3R04_05155 [bacterium]|nr:hypothetical protein [bacterium]
MLAKLHQGNAALCDRPERLSREQGQAERHELGRRLVAAATVSQSSE